MNESKVAQFRRAHKKDKPLILLNIWDVASANELTKQNITLIPTGSYAMSDFYGYQDGENMPFNDILKVITQLTSEKNYLTVDLEAGYSSNLKGLASTIQQVVNSGAIGINIEDKNPTSGTLYSIEEQCERLFCIKKQLKAMNKDLFVNVRTDTYFSGNSTINTVDKQLLNQTITRIKAYEKAGIDGIFIPGLKDTEIIKKLAVKTHLPLNIMLDINEDSIKDYLNIGVSRISFGPSIYLHDKADKTMTLAAFLNTILTKLAPYSKRDQIELFRID